LTQAGNHPGSGGDTSSARATRADAFLLVSVGVLWGSAYVAIREGILAGATPFAYAGARYGLVAVAFALIALARRDPWPGRRSAALSAGVGGVFIIGAYGALLYWGEQYTTGGYASVMAGLAPILTVVYGHLLLPSERLRPLAIVGIAVGFLGTVVLVFPSLWSGVGGDWQGPAAVLAAFAVFPMGTILLRRWGRGGEGNWNISLQLAKGTVILGCATLLDPAPEHLPLTVTVWIWLLVLVVFASLLGYSGYFSLHHRAGPGRANLVAYVVPVVGVGIGSGFFGEPITVWEIAGFVLIVLALSLVFSSRGWGKNPSTPPPPTQDANSTN